MGTIASLALPIIMEERKRAKVVSISSPEHSSTASGVDPMIVVALVAILAIVVIVAIIVIVKMRSKNKKLANVAGQPAQTVAGAGMAAHAAQNAATAGTKPCMSCGTPIPANAGFCPRCGSNQAPEQTTD